MMAIQPGHLVALDALTLNELWRADGIQNFAKFVPLVIADGNVYLATWGKPTSPDAQVKANLVVYGLLRR
jgi:outer membrane protein assembly factor BamB